MQGIYNYKQGS